MWKFSKRTLRSQSAHTIRRSLYSRYVWVVVSILLIIGIIQVQTLRSTLIIAGETTLVFNLRDALYHQKITPENLHSIAPQLLHMLSSRAVNVAVYDAHLRLIGKQMAAYDPMPLQPMTTQIANGVWGSEDTPYGRFKNLRILLSHGSIQVYAPLGTRAQPAGYLQIAYRDQILYPFIWRGMALYFTASVLLLIFAAISLLPVVESALAPLHRLLATASRIRSGAVEERLPVMGTRETEQLAVMINEGLDQLQESVRQEKEITQRMKRFVSSASHELRTPLTSLKGFSEVLLRRLDTYRENTSVAREIALNAAPRRLRPLLEEAFSRDEQLAEIRHAVASMQNETTRLEELVSDLLQLARLDEHFKLNRCVIDLSEFVAEHQIQYEILSKGQKMFFHLTPCRVACDPSLLQQVIYNLIMNALHYTHVQTGEIHVTVSPRGAEGAILEVSDNGPGIDPAHLERIFDRFFRASEARERNPGGAGLGLSICAAIIAAHEGKIYAQSTLGVGTTMTVEL